MFREVSVNAVYFSQNVSMPANIGIHETANMLLATAAQELTFVVCVSMCDKLPSLQSVCGSLKKVAVEEKELAVELQPLPESAKCKCTTFLGQRSQNEW